MKKKSYARKINSLEDLKAEKLRLKHEARHIFSFDPKSGDTIVNNGLSNTPPNSNDYSFDFLNTASSSQLINTVLSIGLPITKLIGINLERKMVTKVAKSVLVTYLKWKALELGYKSLRSFIKSKKS